MTDTSQTDWIALLPSPLPTDRAVAFVTDPAAGGIALFLGVTRADTSPAGHPLLALDYEAYTEMALTQFAQIAADARRQWPITRLAILHRTGRVRIAEPSVLVAVSTPHRQAAFDACRWIMDTLKSSAAIWKQEIWAEGAATWVHPDPPISK